jgi:hypothetical protein
LITKTIGPELKPVLDLVVKMVNFIKQRPLKSRILAELCGSMESPHVKLLLHTELRWLSRGKFLSRFYELREEILVFSLLKKWQNLLMCSKISNGAPNWLI